MLRLPEFEPRLLHWKRPIVKSRNGSAVSLPLTAEDECREIDETILFYECKYVGAFEETLGNKPALTGQEERDAREWRYLLRKRGEWG